jgi:solute carrier family 25 S-adenosylmethionine transporter 26
MLLQLSTAQAALTQNASLMHVCTLQGMDARARTVLCAVMGDITGHLILAPAEVVKAQMQMRLHSNLASAAGAVLSKGPASWFRGYGGMLMRDVPYRALQIILFDEMARAYMAHKKSKHLTLEEMLATGAAAGCTAAAITTPFDLVRSRLMLQSGSQNALQNLGTAVKADGARVLASSA